MDKQKLFIGGSGHVYGIDRFTGRILWETELKKGWIKTGKDFVTLFHDKNGLFAFAYGNLYQLDKETGCILWENEIPKLKNSVGIISSETVFSYESGTAEAGDGDGGGDGGDGGGGD